MTKQKTVVGLLAAMQCDMLTCSEIRFLKLIADFKMPKSYLKGDTNVLTEKNTDIDVLYKLSKKGYFNRKGKVFIVTNKAQTFIKSYHGIRSRKEGVVKLRMESLLREHRNIGEAKKTPIFTESKRLTNIDVTTIQMAIDVGGFQTAAYCIENGRPHAVSVSECSVSELFEQIPVSQLPKEIRDTVETAVSNHFSQLVKCLGNVSVYLW